MNTPPEDDSGPAFEETYDAVLVGTGTGTLLAAIHLAAAGLRPVLIERAEEVGGASAWSGGVVWAPANHRMRAKGLADSPEEALAYLDAVSLGRGDGAVARAYVERIGPVLESIERETEMAWMSYRGLPDYFAEIPGGKPDGRCLLPQPRVVTEALSAAAREFPELAAVRRSVHFPGQPEEWAAGRGLVGCLWLRVIQDGTPVALRTRASSLVVEDGAVTGIEVEGPQGRRRIGARRGVLLGSGGFEWDQAMTRACVPGPALRPQTPPGMTGDGQRMAAAVGAQMALMDQTISTPGVTVAGEGGEGRALCRICFQELTLPGSIVVNRAGRRFADETFFQDLARGWAAVDGGDPSYPNLPMFLVFDGSYRRRFGFPAAVPDGEGVSEHASLAALAAERGIDPAGLEAQVERFNADAERGSDPQFGRGSTAYRRAFAPSREDDGDPTRDPPDPPPLDGANKTRDPLVPPRPDGANPTIAPLAEPPFHCLELVPGTSGHRGGIRCDERGRALGVDGEPIPGLYACGATAAGLATGATYLTGTSLGNALVFGEAAAEQMLACDQPFV